MPIVIARDGDLNARTPTITQEQRDALWAAFVTSWLDKHQDEFQTMLVQPAPQSASL